MTTKYMIRSTGATAALLLGILGTNVASTDKGSFPEVLQLPNGLTPEGIAVGKKNDFYVGNLGHWDPEVFAGVVVGGAIYKGNLRSGEGHLLVPASEGKSAVGLWVEVHLDD